MGLWGLGVNLYFYIFLMTLACDLHSFWNVVFEYECNFSLPPELQTYYSAKKFIRGFCGGLQRCVHFYPDIWSEYFDKLQSELFINFYNLKDVYIKISVLTFTCFHLFQIYWASGRNCNHVERAYVGLVRHITKIYDWNSLHYNLFQSRGGSWRLYMNFSPFGNKYLCM